jgi:hypothetical protein
MNTFGRMAVIAAAAGSVMVWPSIPENGPPALTSAQTAAQMAAQNFRSCAALAVSPGYSLRGEHLGLSVYLQDRKWGLANMFRTENAAIGMASARAEKSVSEDGVTVRTMVGLFQSPIHGAISAMQLREIAEENVDPVRFPSFARAKAAITTARNTCGSYFQNCMNRELKKIAAYEQNLAPQTEIPKITMDQGRHPYSAFSIKAAEGGYTIVHRQPVAYPAPAKVSLVLSSIGLKEDVRYTTADTKIREGFATHGLPPEAADTAVNLRACLEPLKKHMPDLYSRPSPMAGG